jgi:spore germination cell wall hydrolase CwlJ-like protein
MKVLSLLLLLLPAIAVGGEPECLASIMYSEASGESISGIIAVAQSSINRSKITKRSICTIHGVTRRPPPTTIAKHYVSLAQSILDGGVSIVGKADSWDRSLKPRYAGKIVRHIGRHTFYVSKRLG